MDAPTFQQLFSPTNGGHAELEAILDPGEETFLLFSQPLPAGQDLGFVDNKASSLNFEVAGSDFTIVQSPTLLSSNRPQGTTGAVVWKVTPAFAEWIADPNNLLFQARIIQSNATVLELGCGTSGIIPLILSSKVGHYVATDQDYVFKLLKQNMLANTCPASATEASNRHKAKDASVSNPSAIGQGKVELLALDWETTAASSLSQHPTTATGIDVLIACDCIYNEQLVPHFTRTCVEICRLRRLDGVASRPTVCVIAQQLRSDIVLQSWLSEFCKFFRVWRVPNQYAGKHFENNTGFVLHLAVLSDHTSAFEGDRANVDL